MSDKNWKINKKPPKKFIEQFPEYSRLILQLLWDRKLRTQEAIDEFFNPDYNEDIHDPFLMKGMEKAVHRIKQALKDKQKIVVFGDYDADGVCGVAVLSETLKFLGADFSIYIPDRNKEGYGLNNKAIREIVKNKTNLIITVDCGITDFEEIELANKLGVDVVIVDHHEVSQKIPRAVAIVNPRQKNETYPFKELAATGVAFKVVQALLRKYYLDKIQYKGWEKWLLDLVAIATVTDVMPMRGENRTLVKYGLVVLAQTKRKGLKELMNLAKIKPKINTKLLATNLDTYTLGFIIGPRLNSAGRIDHANTAYELLVTDSAREAKKIAQNLNDKNYQRQKMTDRIIKEIEKKDKILQKRKIIFEGSKEWPVGIVGLIAGRLADKYYRPTIIFQEIKSISKGSARSIPSFNIIEAISQCRNLLDEFGGHPGAAGFTLSNKNLKNFENKLLKIANKKLKSKDLIPALNIDIELMPEEINFNTYDEIQKLAPFGEGNLRPLFLLKKMKITNFRVVGKNCTHLKIYLKKEMDSGERNKTFEAIGFGFSGFCDKIKLGDELDVVFELITNEWNGTRELQLKIVDLKKSV